MSRHTIIAEAAMKKHHQFTPPEVNICWNVVFSDENTVDVDIASLLKIALNLAIGSS